LVVPSLLAFSGAVPLRRKVDRFIVFFRVDSYNIRLLFIS